MKQGSTEVFVDNAELLDGSIYRISAPPFYCRPICKRPASLTKDAPVFYTAAAAEHAGFQPCNLCHPEAAPFPVPSDPEDSLARILLCRLQDSALTYKSLETVSRDFGLTSRHIRRVIQRNYGASPIQIAQTYRLHLAKRLLQETSLPIGEIAEASGFTSVRRLNSLFSSRYKCTPSKMRVEAQSFKSDSRDVSLELSYRAPYDFSSILSHLCVRALPYIEEVTTERYSRSVASGSIRGWFSVEEGSTPNTLKLTVSRTLVPMLAQIINGVRRLFDLAADPISIAERLGPLAFDSPGLRIPGAFEPVEVAIRTVVAHFYSEDEAQVFLKKFLSVFAENFQTPFRTISRTITADGLVEALTQQNLITLGLARPIANQLNALGKNIQQRLLNLQPTPYVIPLLNRLIGEVGLDPCAATYIALRCLNWKDAFPHQNIEIAKVIGSRYQNSDVAVEDWKPWRGYAAFQLFSLLAKDASERSCTRKGPGTLVCKPQMWL
jgi:AraC family transcriptional regulator, regulatory protein of adaptative response / DNA-3-methyladenine glycosylase II